MHLAPTTDVAVVRFLGTEPTAAEIKVTVGKKA